ncbi:MAG: hypothetical protein IJS09_00390 [Treponema sp.]|nr:hypothetical protein [Treponema sp.]
MKKTVVQTCDYDFYTMRLPLSVIRRRKRSVFVRRELERRHPQFSEKCCADTKYLFRRGKLMAEVAVMDTLRLAEYRKRFPDKRLFLEGKPDRAVFARRHGNLGKAIFMAVAGVCALFGWKYMKPQQEQTVTEEPVAVAAAAVLLTPEKLLASILSCISRKGGCVTALKWQAGNCTFSVTGCHPEDIAPDTACAVSYAHNEPRFELKMPVAYTNALLAGGDNQFLPHVRNQLLKSGIVILREEAGAKDVSIQMFCKHERVSDALKICAEQSDLHQWHERAIQLQSNDSGCDIRLSFSAGARFYEELSPFQVIATYASVFVPKQQEEKIVPRNRRAEEMVVSREKIGEIKRINGEIFSYYRLHDGSIVCERAQ